MKITGSISGARHVLGVFAALALFVPGLVAVATSHDGEGQTALHDLASVDELKTIFNAGKGDPRLLVLLSPT